MALIPEDRKTEGLMLPMSVRDNLSMASLDRISTGGLVDRAAESKAIDEMIALLAIKTDGTDGAGRRAFRRQPAEDRHRQMADDQARASSCSTIRPAASMSAPRQEIYQLLRKLADAGRGDPLLLDRL